MDYTINQQTIAELLIDHYADLIPRIIYPPMMIYHDYRYNQILIYQRHKQPTLRIIICETTFAVDYFRCDWVHTESIPVFNIEWAHPESINCLDTIVNIFLKDPAQAFRERLYLAYLEVELEEIYDAAQPGNLSMAEGQPV